MHVCMFLSIYIYIFIYIYIYMLHDVYTFIHVCTPAQQPGFRFDESEVRGARLVRGLLAQNSLELMEARASASGASRTLPEFGGGGGGRGQGGEGGG